LDLARRIAGYIAGQRRPDGLPAYQFSPWSGTVGATGTATRVLLAVSGLLEAASVLGGGLSTVAGAMVDRFVDGDQVGRPRPGLSWDSAADAQLLSCLCLAGRRDEHRDLAARLVRRLRPLVRPDGAVYAGAVRMSADLDLLSGCVLLALARADDWLGDALAGIDLSTIWAFYRRRFELAHPWGMVWWHGQAGHALAARDERFGRLADDLVDWALERQSAVSGAFLVHDLAPRRISFLTACVLEAVADRWAAARDAGDEARACRYADAWHRGVSFVDLLTLRAGDATFSPCPDQTIGGVRATRPSSVLRIDMAGHALVALAKGLRVSA
jgi:hypothetical protein